MLKAKLTQGPIGKHLLTMALPMVVGLMANMSIQAVDMWFISQLGQDALAAMGFIFPVTMVFLSLSIGLSAGAASVVARQLANNDVPYLKRLITDTQTLAFCLALTAAILGWLTVDDLFSLLGAGPHLLPLIRDYIHIFYFNGLLTMLGMVALSVVRATGNTRAQGMAMLLGAALNAVLDPLLIFGLWGFPRLEIQGAALASTAARLLSLFIAYYYLIGRLSLLTMPWVSIRRIWHSWRAVLHIALPAMGTNIIIPVSAAIITALLAGFGEEAVAGMGVAQRIEPLMLIAFYALSSVIGPFVGQNLGALEIKRIFKGVNIASIFALSYGALLALFLWFFAEPIVALFSQDKTTLMIAKDYLWIVPISYGCSGIVMTINASFNGIGKPMPAVVISALRVFILYLPAAFAASHFYGVNGIFMAYTAVNIICAMLAYVWFRRVTWHASQALKASSQA